MLLRGLGILECIKTAVHYRNLQYAATRRLPTLRLKLRHTFFV